MRISDWSSDVCSSDLLFDRLILGAPHDQPQPFCGPVIDNRAADDLQEAFLGLMMKGGQHIRRLDRPVEGRPSLTPALIDVTNVAPRPDDALFVPVLQPTRVPDFCSATAAAGTARSGLSPPPFSRAASRVG